MLMFAACRWDTDARSVRERLEAAAAGLVELEQLRRRHEALVRGALEVREEQQQEAGAPPETEKALQENILLLRKQLSCLRRRDAGLITQLQELDRQISKLRLDTEASHDPLEADSRPSSGFFDLSDGASVSLSNSSNSVFSECLGAAAEADVHFLSAEDLPCFLDCDWPQPPSLDSAHNEDKPHPLGLGFTRPQVPAPPPDPAPPLPPAAVAAPQRRLDEYILGLLQRRAPVVRPGRLRTSISTESSRAPKPRGLRPGHTHPEGATLRVGRRALPGGGAFQELSGNSSVPHPRPLPAASCLGREGAGSYGLSEKRVNVVGRGRGTRVATVGGASWKSSRNPGAPRSARRHRQPHPQLLPPRDQQLRRSGAHYRQQSRQPAGCSTHQPRPSGRWRQTTESESKCSAKHVSLLRCPPLDASSSCFGDGESVQEALQEEGATSRKGRNQVRPLSQEVTRAVTRIKASHQLKKKILRFRSGSLKHMTTV